MNEKGRTFLKLAFLSVLFSLGPILLSVLVGDEEIIWQATMVGALAWGTLP